MKTYIKKTNNYDFTNMDETEIYQMLLDGKIKKISNKLYILR